MMNHKSVYVPELTKQKLQLGYTDRSVTNYQGKDEEGEFTSVSKIINSLDEGIWIINEFNIPKSLVKTKPKPVKQVLLYFTNTKTVVKDPERYVNSSFFISLKKEDFMTNHGVIYLPALNIVIATDSAMERVDVKHPFPIPGFYEILNHATEKFNETVKSFGYCWWINEAQETNKVYYLSFMGNIIVLGKTHYPGPDVLVLLAPNKKDDGYKNNYTSQSFSISDLKLGEVKSIEHSTSYGNYTFLLSADLDELKKEILKKRNSIRPSIEIEDYKQIVHQLESDKDQALSITKQEYETKLEEIKKSHIEKAEEISKKLTTELNNEIKKNKALSAAIDSVEAANKVFSNYNTKENSVKVSEHRVGAKEEGGLSPNEISLLTAVTTTIVGYIIAKIAKP